jgi:phosphoribosyl 1,2-cyclic phosphate phosphodiesterase
VQVTLLGTGSAWGLPELGCKCRVCRTLKVRGEERTRTCLLLRGRETLLLDCGPDIRRQLMHRLPRPPAAVLITHAHGDHFLGLDELVAYRRLVGREAWKPIPTYATAAAWSRIEQVFGYLLDSLLEKRVAQPGRLLTGLHTRIRPFATNHGPVAKGSVGYVVEEDVDGAGVARLLYTGDFVDLVEEPVLEGPLHLLVIQSHWLHEPRENRPHHMSFQRALEYIRRWDPKRVCLVHLSEEYPVEHDETDRGLKGTPAKAPLLDPRTGRPYPNPLSHADWQQVVDRIAEDQGLHQRPIVGCDGLTIRI